jgi:hypothetical protein
MEAVMHHYGIGNEERMQLQGKKGHSWLDIAYSGEGLAITFAQFPLLSGLLRSEQVHNSITGEDVNAWDGAHVWDPTTGKVTLKEGINQVDINKIILKGKGIQTITQGNFEKVDQPEVVENLFGQMLMQFHRHFPTTMTDRIGSRYNNLMLGETEGSWRTVLSYINLVREFDGHWTDSMKGGWNNLKDYQKKNLYLCAMDLMMGMTLLAVAAVIREWAKDLGEESSTEKRWLNFFAYTTSRIRFENQMYTPGLGFVTLAEYIQNPIAMSTTLKSFAQALYLTAEWPFQDDDDRDYKNGPFAGSSKAGRATENAVPGLKAFKKWQDFDRESDYGGSILGINK